MNPGNSQEPAFTNRSPRAILLIRQVAGAQVWRVPAPPTTSWRTSFLSWAFQFWDMCHFLESPDAPSLGMTFPI